MMGDGKDENEKLLSNIILMSSYTQYVPVEADRDVKKKLYAPYGFRGILFVRDCIFEIG